MKKIYLFLFIIVLVVIPGLYSEEIQDWKKLSQKFWLESLARDIANADYNQLKSMAMTLGLEEETTSAAYRNALAKYYGIQLINIKKTKKNGDVIRLVRAGELKTFKFKEENEENLHIIGRAKIILSSKGKDNKLVERTIEADEIFINTKNKEITGIGNVRFKDDRLEYEGIQFYYNYDLNRGVLFEGRTQLIKGGDSGLDGAFFRGEKVAQTGQEDIILYNGMLTTCEEYNPHYYMKVSRLWVSEKGEWGILNGVVHIGPIPFFYFPVYYHPKDLIINPAFGFRSREGWYLNTTYYILGKKEGSSDDDSTNQTTTSTTSSTNKTVSASSLISYRRKDPKNLFILKYDKIFNFLTKYYDNNDFYKKYPDFRIYPKLDSIDIMLNVFGDAYTNIGLYGGAQFYINAKYNNFPFKIHLITDYALSRRIWQDNQTGLYYPFDPTDTTIYNNGGRNTYYNFSQFGLNLFRTSQWLNFNGSLFKNYVNFKYDFQLEYASDKSYFTDFYNRELNFTYMDLLADTISSSIQRQGDGVSGISTTTDTESTLDYTDLNTFLSLNFSPIKYPDIFGLKIISNVSVDIESRAVFKSTEIPDVDESANAENPRKDRYLLYSYTAPELKSVKIQGTILDYDTFIEMDDKIKMYKKSKKNVGKTEKEKLYTDVYRQIVNINNIDNTSDKTKIDYKSMLPFYSKNIPLSQIADKKSELYYSEVIRGDEDFTYKRDEIMDDTEKEKDYLKIFTDVAVINLFQKVNYDVIKPVDFNLTYTASNSLNNKFFFDTTPGDNAYNTRSDTLELLFLGGNTAGELINSITQRMQLVENFSFNLIGDLDIIKISNSPLFGFSPKYYYTFTRQYDNESIYIEYLKNIGVSDKDERRSKMLYYIEENLKSSAITMKYNDVITNDLSFGVYRFKGTGIKTTLNIDIFSQNLEKVANYYKLNKLNDSDSLYRDDLVYSYPSFYDLRIGYEKIKTFESKFTFNVNILEQNNPHQLSMGIGPLLKWVIPSTELTILKNELWDEENEDILYTNSTIDEAKEYLYYRKNGPGNNLYDKISRDFFATENFWEGRKNFRKMFDSVTYNIQYSYTNGTVKVVTINNDFIIKPDNIGVFSNLDPYDLRLEMYPNENFSIGLLNSIISYSMGITFTKKVNPYYENSTSDDQKLDEYNIMTMTNSHSFILKIPGNIFRYKLKSGDWLSFAYTTGFKWDRTLSSTADWLDGSRYNYFYLDSQKITLSLLMDIFKLELNFKKFNFQNYGYGLELDSGKIDIGYRITEIPIFWRYFKLIIEPRLSYNFIVKHTNYDDGSGIKSYNVDYYSNNTLTFSFNVDLIIGAGTNFETTLHFGMKSMNNKMYDYYSGTGISRSHWDGEIEYGIGAFFRDLGDSFNFGNITARRNSPFNLQLIEFWLEHKLCDWSLKFKYVGMPQKSNFTGRYNWENTFEFSVTWAVKSNNQLMKMFNKTKLDAKYNYLNDAGNYTGEWQQPIISLDPNEE